MGAGQGDDRAGSRSRAGLSRASAGARSSSDPAFKEALTLNGQDVAGLYLQVLELGGKAGYMKYRTVPVFPQVGDKINKAIERIATGQQNGAEADGPGPGRRRCRPQEGGRRSESAG